MKRLRPILKQSLRVAAIAPIVAAVLFIGGTESAKAYSGYTYPCSGYGVSGYAFAQWVSGWGYHIGEDVCSGAGRAVYAASEGTVVYSAKTPDSYRWGNLIMIQHSGGGEVTTIYGHLSNDRRVGVGATVTKGQLIGFTGPSYTAENGNWSAHLHFGVRGGPYNAPAGSYDSGISGYKTNGVSPYMPGGQFIRDRAVVNDYQVVNVIGHGNYGKNQEYYVDFQLRNTGSSTWRISGEDAMRLGTIRPNDRGSMFSLGQLGQGWAANNRIALMADTPPGGIGTFRAKFSNDAVPPGYYVERFAPVIDGEGWLADRDLAVGINVLPPRNIAQWAGQGVYTSVSPNATTNPTESIYLLPGQKLNAKAYIRNAGDVPWQVDGPNPIRLGTVRPVDRGSAFAVGGDGSIPISENWPNYNRPSAIDGRYDQSTGLVTPVSQIQPGEVAVFSFAIKVPNAPGDYAEYFNPVHEGRGWLNDLGMWFRFRVLPPGNHYEWVGHELPAPFQLGRTSSGAKLYIRNTGQSNWNVGGNVRLGTDRGFDRASAFSAGWLSPNRAAAIDANMTNPGDNVIRPGNVARFSLNFQSESVRDGTYPEYFRPVVDGVGWMPEDYGIHFPVTVSSPARDYKVVSQLFTTDVGSLSYGESFTAKLAVRNLGNATWTVGGANPVRMATSRPDDRGSGFNVLNGPDPWLGVNRPSAIDGKVTDLDSLQTTSTAAVGQSEVAYLNIPMKVPGGLTFGPYFEYFNFVQEGQGWFPDLGVYFPLMVTGI